MGPLILGSTVAISLLMVTLWLIQLRTRNAGIVDFGWSASLGVLAITYAVLGPGDPLRRALIGVIAGIWSFRLAIHLLLDRIVGREEEGRYKTMRETWVPFFQLKMLAFYEAQALLAVILSVPFLLIAFDKSPAPTALDLAGAALWLIGVAGESIADRQLVQFKKDPLSRGKTCRRGLWRYSRHPNYFFEWLIWGSYALIAFGAPHGWIALGAPALMLFFILKVTGIPPTEEQALKSRGDDYRRYQRTTSAFVPWFPKKDRG